MPSAAHPWLLSALAGWSLLPCVVAPGAAEYTESIMQNAAPGFATKTGDCVYVCESGYHAALNKSSLRITAERLEALAREEDPDRFALQAPESDKVYAAARARGGSECKFQGLHVMNRIETMDPMVGDHGTASWDFRDCCSELQLCYATCHHGRKKIFDRLEGKMRCDQAYRECARQHCVEATGGRGPHSDMCEGDVGITMQALSSNGCVAYMSGQYESCKCVETKYKGKPLKGPKPPKETPEFNNLAEALAAVKAEQAGDDATWMPLDALISAQMFHDVGDRVGYSVHRPPTARGEDERNAGGERVRVDTLDVLRKVWAEYDEWDDDYEWQAGSEGVVVELDLADGTALVSFDE